MSNGLWITAAELPDDLAGTEFADEACESASFLLWGMSGRKFSGVYTVTERYLIQERTLDERYYLAPGVGYAVPASIHLISSIFVKHDTIRLRGTPTTEVVEIRAVATGEVVPADYYDLWDHTTIKFHSRIPGDLDITYTYGVLPPAAGRMAARDLATQFAMLWGGREDECSLPSRVTNVNRQGVSWVLLDQQDFINELRTGIYAVDLFLKTVNPDRARARTKVFSPDIPRGKRKTPGI
jgi:hypothetical protein